MNRRSEFEKEIRRTPPSPTLRFSRTFDLLLNQFPDSIENSDVNLNQNSRMSSTSTRSNIWRTSIAAPICAFCNKSVFPAEELNAAGQKFHKLCLKCTSCHTLLSLGNLDEHEKKIYCSSCYRRQFGPRGVGRGLANSLLTPPTSPSPSRDEFEEKRTFPRYASMVPSEDENRQAKRNTFAPGTKTRPTLNAVFNRSSTNSITNGSALRSLTIGTNVCPRCSKTVYSAEEIKAVGKSFHRRCYTCAHCNRSINAGRYSEHEGEIYDNICYQRLFGPKGVGFGIGSGTLSTGQ